MSITLPWAIMFNENRPVTVVEITDDAGEYLGCVAYDHSGRRNAKAADVLERYSTRQEAEDRARSIRWTVERLWAPVQEARYRVEAEQLSCRIKVDAFYDEIREQQRIPASDPADQGKQP